MALWCVQQKYKTSIVNAGLCMIVLSAFFQTAFAEEKSIPKTAEPLLIEAKKKPHHQWVPRETYTIEQLVGYQEKPDPEYSRYGGMVDTQFPATGFFYTKKYNDRWWLVDPEGHLCIHKAVCSVSPGGSNAFTQNRRTKFGSEEDWAEATTALLKELGFNGSASWSDNPCCNPQRTVRCIPRSGASWLRMPSSGALRKWGRETINTKVA